jgi:hypothetical protein
MANVGLARSIARVAALALVVLASRAAVAQPSAEARARASALQAEGHRLLMQNENGAALERFEAAYALVASPKVLFNMGRAHERLGHHPEAFDCFDRFLTDARDVPPESRAQAERSRAELRARVALVEIMAPAGAQLWVDGRTVGHTPLPRTLPLLPGVRVFRLERDGSVLTEKAVPVAAGAVTRFVLDIAAAAPVVQPLPPRLLPTQTPAPAPTVVTRPAVEEPRPVYTRWWFWTTLGVVVAAAVTTAAATGAFRRKDAGCPMEWQCP